MLFFFPSESKYRKTVPSAKVSKLPKNAMFDTVKPLDKNWTSDDLPSSVYVCDYATYANIKCDPKSTFLDIDGLI